VRRATILTAGLVSERGAFRARLRSPGAEKLRELSTACLRLLERRSRSRTLGVACGLVVAPAAGPLANSPCVRLDRGDPINGSVEEGAVVGDDDERAAIGLEEPLEAREPVEVEVVRRLVEQEHVEPGEEDRSQSDARGLAARDALEPAVEVDPEPQLGEARPRASPEVPPPGARKRSSATE
jgi:hypothetical protein